MCVVSTLNHVSANGVLRVCESVVCVGMEDDTLGLSLHWKVSKPFTAAAFVYISIALHKASHCSYSFMLAFALHHNVS